MRLVARHNQIKIISQIEKYRALFSPYVVSHLLIDQIGMFKSGNGELLELRLLETGFLSRFQNKMSRF